MRGVPYSLFRLRRQASLLLSAAALLFALNVLLHPLFHTHKDEGTDLHAQESCLVCSGAFQEAETPAAQELPRLERIGGFPLLNTFPAADRLPVIPCSRGPPVF